MKKFGVVLLLVVASIAVLSACGSTKTITTSDGSVTISDNGKSVTDESSNGSKVEATDQKVTINSENGGKTEITSDKTLPDTFPKDVPLPDNAAIDGSVKSSIDTFLQTGEHACRADILDEIRRERTRPDRNIDSVALVASKGL